MASTRTVSLSVFGLSLLLVGVLAFSATPAKAQMQDQEMMGPSAKNALYVELAGNSLIYSLNYDRRFSNKISGRVGLMRAGVSGVSLTAFPLMVNYLLGSGNHRFEIGAGPQIFLVSVDVPGDGFSGFDEDATAIAGTATIGYRYQPTDGGFVFRIGVTPSFSQFGFQPWGGLSLGYAF